MITKEMFSEKELEKNEKELEKRAEARICHSDISVMPQKFPMLWVRDKLTGKEHLYGTDVHDSLWIGPEGQLHYFNFKTGDGTGEHGSYEFVDHSGQEGEGSILEFYPAKNIIL